MSCNNHSYILYHFFFFLHAYTPQQIESESGTPEYNDQQSMFTNFISRLANMSPSYEVSLCILIEMYPNYYYTRSVNVNVYNSEHFENKYIFC